MIQWLLNSLDKETQDSIVRIDLALNNEKMINLLINRGEAIGGEQEDLIKKWEDKISDLKEEQYYTEICGAFIIFDDFKMS